ncbi:hypothetical protein P175DRAFT_0558125 [Aspergillus ochraceoroseus IBT 24754]|uniref:Uncharacterized protein n=1 Tax=Aspergillus ochraceoroseus IBT 24754 TaxID=1392256 RepID=A0A2T5LUI0_9EURO|nr:uncharacterized protein P175DRAFT_0558125 [Aspergillus ochraceoroseus IBT 24754]PTU19930.1 hypothetical protein P175DRAFT_0558125 [Aspergillus ochraceoroseus IBT 24754]
MCDHEEYVAYLKQFLLEVLWEHLLSNGRVLREEEQQTRHAALGRIFMARTQVKVGEWVIWVSILALSSPTLTLFSPTLTPFSPLSPRSPNFSPKSPTLTLSSKPTPF